MLQRFAAHLVCRILEVVVAFGAVWLALYVSSHLPA